MFPCASMEEKGSAWRRERGIIEVIMQLHLGGYPGGFREETRNGQSGGGFRQDVGDKRAGMVCWFGRDGPHMCFEPQNGVGVRGGKGSGAGVPTGRRVGGESHAPRGLRVIARGIARNIGVRNDADCGVRAAGGE